MGLLLQVALAVSQAERVLGPYQVPVALLAANPAAHWAVLLGFPADLPGAVLPEPSAPLAPVEPRPVEPVVQADQVEPVGQVFQQAVKERHLVLRPPSHLAELQ